MTGPADEDLQRLASRLALLTSDDGEAENAGRAAGQLARRIGLSGGQLKAIFLAGVRATGGTPPATPESDALAEATRMQPEVAELRKLLDRSDTDLQAARQQRAALHDENERLREALDRARSFRQVWLLACVVLLVAVLGASGFAVFGPRLRPAPGEGAVQADPGAAGVSAVGLPRLAVVGPSGATIRLQPDPEAPIVARLPAGAAVPVHRLLWQGFRQWIETERDGQTGYAPVTEVDLR